MIYFFGIYWESFDKIYLAPVFIIAIFFIFKNYFNKKKNIKQLVADQNLSIIFKNFSIKKQLLKAILLSLALISIFIAILQPQWGKKEYVVPQEGRDLLILFDVSRSMLAKDLKPNRLDFTKLKIRNLLKKLNFERVGLILFSGTAFLQCPLTSDFAAFLMYLDQVDVGTISSGTTAIDSALIKAVEVFSASKGRKNKLILLATDGEDFSLNLDRVKQIAAQEEIKVFALGVGTESGAPIPKFDSQGNQIGHETDQNGRVVLSVLNEKLLRQIAEQLHGDYLRAVYDDSDLDKIVFDIRKFEKEKFEDVKISYYEDKYPWFLGFAWIMLALEWIL